VRWKSQVEKSSSLFDFPNQFVFEFRVVFYAANEGLYLSCEMSGLDSVHGDPSVDGIQHHQPEIPLD
jgi:hypothetical protein